MPDLPYCVYVLISQSDGDLYTGFTKDLQRRLGEHNAGQSLATAPRRPFRLLFCEYHDSKSDALKRESYLKTSAGKRTLRLMCRDALADFRQIDTSVKSSSSES
jgi:putative endonuclease